MSAAKLYEAAERILMDAAGLDYSSAQGLVMVASEMRYLADSMVASGYAPKDS